jgi:hypothetical protein
MKTLLMSLTLLLSLKTFANQGCVDIFNKMGCGYKLECILTKGNQIPAECRESYEEWIVKAHSQSPCEQEKLKVCGSSSCTEAQAKGLSPKCAKEFVQNRNMEVGAQNMGIACEADFKQHCGVDFRKPAAQDNEKMMACMTSKKSSFSAKCQEAVNQMFGGAL